MQSMLLGMGAILGAITGGGALAQDMPGAPRIDVLGIGSVELPPETATIRYTIRGEGQSAEAATRALVDRRKMVDNALGAAGGATLTINTGRMSVQAVRGPDCPQDYSGVAPRLSTGTCAVQGYAAMLEVTLTISPVKNAGTLTGAIAQAGGSDTTLAGFGVLDPAAGRRQALARAMANGREQAQAIAGASGVHLGKLLRVTSPDSQDIGDGLQGLDRMTRPRVEQPAPAPVPVGVDPDKIKVTARLSLSYEILP